MKTNVQQTSLEAYYSLTNLSDQQQTILVAINAYPDSTDREIAEKLGYADPNRVRPRRFELEEMGYIVASGKRICRVSGKAALTWRVKHE